MNYREHRRRKVLNIGGPWFRIFEVGGWGGGWGGQGGGKLFAGCKLTGASRPQSVPNNYISHNEN